MYLGLDFFQLISLVDLIHFLSTMSLKSPLASCSSRRTCKYGQRSLPLLGPALRVSTASIHLSVHPSILYPSPTVLRPVVCIFRPGMGVRRIWAWSPTPGTPCPVESVGVWGSAGFVPGAGALRGPQPGG